MSLLLVCKTRQGMLQDVVHLQSDMLNPNGAALEPVNDLIKHAKAIVTLNGMHYKYVGGTPRLVQMTSPEHPAKLSSYPREGQMVLYCLDPEYACEDCRGPLFAGGSTCPLFVSSRKRQRGSHSCSEVSILLAHRITELDYHVRDAWSVP